MALTLNTNVGFVTTAPTADPVGSNTTSDGSAFVVKDTAPAGAVKITAVGWYKGSGSTSSNTQVGLYAADGATVPGEAGTRLQVTSDQGSGTSAGWINFTGLNWPVTAGTAYWLGMQQDSHTGSSTIDSATSGGSGIDSRSSQTALPNPFGGGALADADGMYAIYAVYQKAPTVALSSPADSATGVSTTPDLTFTGTDANSDDVRYMVQVHTNNTFSTQVASDDFNRANGAIGSNWSTHATNGTPQVNSNKINADANDSDCSAYWNGSGSFNNNQYSQATITWGNNGGAGGVSYAGLIVRATSTSCIFVQKDANNNNFIIMEVTGMDSSNIYNEIGRTTTVVANGSVVRAEVIGTTVSVYDDNVLILTAETSITTGKPGLLANDDTDSIDDWSGGDTAPVAVSGTDAGFSGSPDNTDPFTSGQAVTYTVQSALSNSTLYYWRVRGIDPSGSNTYGAWATTRSFTTAAAGGTAVKDIIMSGIIPFTR